MKNRVMAAVLGTAMVAATVTGAGAAAGSAMAAEDVTLTVWGPQEDQSEENGKWLQTECEAFAAAHPEWNITFNYGVCSEGDAKDSVSTDAEAAADVYMYANDQIPDLLSSNALAELGGSTVEQIKANNPETMVNTVTYDGGIYGVPFTANTWFMYYNKSVFSEDDIKSLDAMLEKGKVAFPLSNSWYIASFYIANGCTIFGDGTDAAAGIDFSGDKAVAVTNYLVDLAANSNFMNDADGAGLAGLADGSVAAIFSGSWDYQNVKDALGDNIGVAQLPTYTLDGQALQMKSFAGSKAIGVNPNSKYAQQAVALAAFLGSTEAQQKHYELRNIIPIDTSIDLASDELAAGQVATVANTSVMQPLVAEMANYWTPAESMGKELVSGSVTHDNAAEKTEAMNEAMNTSAVN